MQKLDFEYGRGDLRRAMIAVYGNTCRIGWCQNRRHFLYKESRRLKRKTIDHIHPLNPPPSFEPGKDEIRNTTLACEFCNHKKSNSFSRDLINHLQQEAHEHFNPILKELFKKHISLNGKNKGFYTINVLAYVYAIRITRKGSLVVVRERALNTFEKSEKKVRDKNIHRELALSK